MAQLLRRFVVWERDVCGRRRIWLQDDSERQALHLEVLNLAWCVPNIPARHRSTLS